LTSGLEFSLGQLLILGPSVWLLCFWVWRKQRTHDLATSAPDGLTHANERETPQTRLWTPGVYALAFSCPILALGLVQALNSKALINWSVPMALGVCLWLACWANALELSFTRFVWACVAGLLLSGFIATGGDIKQWVGVSTPANQSKWDIWGRMRGWDEALKSLQPALEPYRDVPWLAGNRSTLVQAAYSLRTLEPKLFAWNSDGGVHHHFEWKQPWPADATATTVVWLNSGEPHPALLLRYPNASLLGEAKSGRITLQAWLLQNQKTQP
jgi:hypothetical protein